MTPTTAAILSILQNRSDISETGTDTTERSRTNYSARFMASNGRAIVLEPQLKTMAPLWIAARGVPNVGSSVAGVSAEFYDEGRSRNSNIAAVPGIGNAAAWKVLPSSADEARLVIDLVCSL